MIIVRAPLSLNFTDVFSKRVPFKLVTRRVLLATIDKYVYVAIHRTPLVDKISVRYRYSETVDHPSKLSHTRVKAALLDLNIKKNIEIGSFSTIPGKFGFGASDSFSVALIKGLNIFLGKKTDRETTAKLGIRLEENLLKGQSAKENHYAVSFGGFNIIQFNQDGSVKVEPLLLDYKKRLKLENHLLVFFINDLFSPLLLKEKNISRIKEKEVNKYTDILSKQIINENFKKLGEFLDSMAKKSYSFTEKFNSFYQKGISSGAWGGCPVGGAESGCMVFVVPPKKRRAVTQSLKQEAKKLKFSEYKEFPISFTQSGTEVIFNGDHYYDFIK